MDDDQENGYFEEAVSSIESEHVYSKIDNNKLDSEIYRTHQLNQDHTYVNDVDATPHGFVKISTVYLIITVAVVSCILFATVGGLVGHLVTRRSEGCVTMAISENADDTTMTSYSSVQSSHRTSTFVTETDTTDESTQPTVEDSIQTSTTPSADDTTMTSYSSVQSSDRISTFVTMTATTDEVTHPTVDESIQTSSTTPAVSTNECWRGPRCSSCNKNYVGSIDGLPVCCAYCEKSGMALGGSGFCRCLHNGIP